MTAQPASQAASPGQDGRGRLTVCAPLSLEARALRRGLPGSVPDGSVPGGSVTVRRTGYGPRRAATAAGWLREDRADALAVAGTCGGLAPELVPGDLVVATRIIGPDGETAASCPAAPLLAGELRRAGLTVHEGPVATVTSLFDAGQRARAAQAGAIAVDMESSFLA
ncbi:MAG TPA: hypothetical protein VGG25_07775, partial [Streptosporangiaceae bacterium]